MELDNARNSNIIANKWANIKPSTVGGFFGAIEHVRREFSDKGWDKRMRVGKTARILHLNPDQIRRVNQDDASVLEELVEKDTETPGLWLVRNTCHVITVDDIVLTAPGNPAQLFEFSPYTDYYRMPPLLMPSDTGL